MTWKVGRYRVGYTQGTFDMFHIGHLNIIRNARKQCERLIVGVNADALVQSYKHKTPVISETERSEIVRNIKGVDECFIATTLDKETILSEHPFDVIFIGDDWKGDPRWESTRVALAKRGVDVVFLPHTNGISSTALTGVIKKILDDNPSEEMSIDDQAN